jgi:hypothetical protein
MCDIDIVCKQFSFLQQIIKVLCLYITVLLFARMFFKMSKLFVAHN